MKLSPADTLWAIVALIGFLVGAVMLAMLPTLVGKIIGLLFMFGSISIGAKIYLAYR